ncbi:MAG TPA: hypothetical protein VGK10_04790 [Prolixibacteraceae bacterium]|jgi:hypothetical protein
MRKTISILILLIGLLVLGTSASQVMAGHPELVSGSPGLVSGSPEVAALTGTASAPSTKASVAGDVQIAFEQTNADSENPGNFFLDNWGSLALGLLTFLDVVARLTPSTRDNSIVNLLTTIINAIIPNFRKGGGTFKMERK